MSELSRISSDYWYLFENRLGQEDTNFNWSGFADALIEALKGKILEEDYGELYATRYKNAIDEAYKQLKGDK